jgi:hypothetical protein
MSNIVKTSKCDSGKVKFSEEDDDELRSDLMEEFNTLSIIYGRRKLYLTRIPSQIRQNAG